MKLAVCSQGKSLDSSVDPRFGRCACFVIVDTETGETQYLDNSAVSAAHGAGSAVVQSLADAGVEAVCAEHIGPNAFFGLSGMGIAMYRTEGLHSVKDAIETFKSGTLALHKEATTYSTPREPVR